MGNLSADDVAKALHEVDKHGKYTHVFGGCKHAAGCILKMERKKVAPDFFGEPHARGDNQNRHHGPVYPQPLCR